MREKKVLKANNVLRVENVGDEGGHVVAEAAAGIDETTDKKD